MRRPPNAVPMLVVVAVLSAGGAIAAAISYRHNDPRAERYAADSTCQAPPQARPSAALVGLCTTEFATIVSRWIHTYKSSHYYRLGLQSADGVVDSVELEGPYSKTLWNGASLGSSVVVRRFAEDAPPARHVTLVASGGLAARTLWNPEWEKGDRVFGVWFLSTVFAACVAALVWIRAHRPATTPDWAESSKPTSMH